MGLTAEQIARIVGAVPGGAPNVQDIYPLAPLQEGILFHHLMEREGDPYLLRSVYRFDSRARLDAYLAALQAVIDRHDVLRTAVLWEGLPEPAQVVLRHAPLVVDHVEIDAEAGDVAEQLAARYDPRHYRLDVRQAPLLRMAVAPDARDGRWAAVLLLHHLSGDHVTVDAMQREIRAHLLGEADRLPAPLPFRNFIAQTRLGVSREEHEAFFSRMLADVDEPTLPFGLTNAHRDGADIVEGRRWIEPSLSLRLRARARSLGVSAATIFHVAWACVLARVSGRDDVVFGTVLFGRMQGGEGADQVLGLFMNTLPVRIEAGDQGVQDAVRDTHALLAELLRHEHASLALAQRCSGVAAPAPLFTALFNYRHVGGAAEADHAERARAAEGIETLGGQERTNYPLTISVNDLGDDFSVTAQADASLDADRICGLLQIALTRLVDALEHAPATPLREMCILPEEERRRVLVEWNATEAPYPAGARIHELIEARAAENPDAVAVVHADAELTYEELNVRANRLARHLRTLGVRSGTTVALCGERCVGMLVGRLAVLKAGAAYVPLDSHDRPERIRFVLADAAPVAALTHGLVPEPVRDLVRALPVPALDVQADSARWMHEAGDNLRYDDPAPDGPAYVIYVTEPTSSMYRRDVAPNGPVMFG